MLSTLPINNYADDQTRVKLKGLSHDYINANFVNVSVVCLLLCHCWSFQSRSLPNMKC